MKTIKKYTTFEGLKSSEKKSTDYEKTLKKHCEFEKAIRAIQSENNKKINIS